MLIPLVMNCVMTPLLVDDAQGRVLGAHQLANAVDDQLEDLLDLEHAADAAYRGVERLQRRRKQGTLGPSGASCSIRKG